MATQGGYGLVVQIGSTPAAIVNVEDVDEIQLTKFIDESTGHDSTGGYYEAEATGKYRMQPFSMTLIWDSAEATHTAVITAFDALTLEDFTFADPAGQETITFKGHVEQIGRLSQQESTYRATVLVHPSGQPTIA